LWNQVFYIDHNTKTTHWKHPSEIDETHDAANDAILGGNGIVWGDGQVTTHQASSDCCDLTSFLAAKVDPQSFDRYCCAMLIRLHEMGCKYALALPRSLDGQVFEGKEGKSATIEESIRKEALGAYGSNMLHQMASRWNEEHMELGGWEVEEEAIHLKVLWERVNGDRPFEDDPYEIYHLTMEGSNAHLIN